MKIKAAIVGALAIGVVECSCAAESIMCPTKEYAQYKDAVASASSANAFAREYCNLTLGFEQARQLGLRREMDQCASERRKAADALSAVKKPLPDCIALDPERAKVAVCHLRTKAEYGAMAKTEAGRIDLKQEYCAADDFMRMKPGKPSPSTDEFMHCLQVHSAMSEAIRSVKVTKADCQS
jgi:hypothetical protein